MSLTVHYLCTYYPQYAHTNIAARTQTLWDAYKYCGAVKNKSINGFCTLPTKVPTRIDETNLLHARNLFGQFIREALGDRAFFNSTFIPVPSKDSWNTNDFRSYVMLRESMPIEVQPNILPIIRFNVERPRAAEGGPRGIDAIYPYLRLLPHGRLGPIVLVDDIVTTGGTLLASRRLLEEHGLRVDCATVCGRTQNSLELAFKVRSFELEDDLGEMHF